MEARFVIVKDEIESFRWNYRRDRYGAAWVDLFGCAEVTASEPRLERQRSKTPQLTRFCNFSRFFCKSITLCKLSKKSLGEFTAQSCASMRPSNIRWTRYGQRLMPILLHLRLNELTLTRFLWAACLLGSHSQFALLKPSVLPPWKTRRQPDSVASEQRPSQTKEFSAAPFL